MTMQHSTHQRRVLLLAVMAVLSMRDSIGVWRQCCV